MKEISSVVYYAKVTGDVTIAKGVKKDGSNYEYASVPVELYIGRRSGKVQTSYGAFRDVDSYIFDVIDELGIKPLKIEEKDGKTIATYSKDNLDEGAKSLDTLEEDCGLTYRISRTVVDLEGKYNLIDKEGNEIIENGRTKYAEQWTITRRVFAFTKAVNAAVNPMDPALYDSNVPLETLLRKELRRHVAEKPRETYAQRWQRIGLTTLESVNQNTDGEDGN